MPVCDLDKKVPHGKKVMGIDVVVWWDCNENAWKVFDDMCPHRLAPLSEGRIDQWGRLQCVYHGWCFDGSSNCKLIPQSPPDGPPVEVLGSFFGMKLRTILFAGGRSFPHFTDAFTVEAIAVREALRWAIGRSILLLDIEAPGDINNQLTAAKQLLRSLLPVSSQGNRDKEGGRPLDIIVKELELQGFDAELGYDNSRFDAPCIFTIHIEVPSATNKGTVDLSGHFRGTLVFVLTKFFLDGCFTWGQT
ncbi:Protochlorophyllide-dependent translocon component 52, chloroplastic [Linum perenne]